MKTLLEKSRYLVLIAVLALLAAALAAFSWGTLKTVDLMVLVVQTAGKDASITVTLISLIDAFLIATTLLIFSLSLYELFIDELTLPDWLLANSLSDLKVKLSNMIVLVMAVKFLEKLLNASDYAGLLQFSGAIFLVSAMLIAFGYLSKSTNDHH